MTSKVLNFSHLGVSQY